MKIQIVLNGLGGELDRQTIETRPPMIGSKADADSDAILETMKAWTLAPGDTIKIVEVE